MRGRIKHWVKDANGESRGFAFCKMDDGTEAFLHFTVAAAAGLSESDLTSGTFVICELERQEHGRLKVIKIALHAPSNKELEIDAAYAQRRVWKA
jgi:cold shock CspA family protein